MLISVKGAVDSKSQNLLISQCSNSLTVVCSILKFSFAGNGVESGPESKYPSLDFIAVGRFHGQSYLPQYSSNSLLQSVETLQS